MGTSQRDRPLTLVVATMNRRSEVLATLGRALDRPFPPPVVVIDNASADGTAAAVRATFPDVALLALPANLGAAARTVGARLATTPLVAFADDDSWWEAGALERATACFTEDPALGLLTGRVLVGTEATLDPTSAAMAAGPLDEWLRPSASGRRGVTGFLACAAVVRREPFLASGGFEPHLVIGGEEELVALRLATAGWKLVYDPEVVVRHHPSPSRDAHRRRRLLARNAVLTAWLAYPPPQALRRSVAALTGPEGVVGAASALRSAGWAAGRRHPVPQAVGAAFEALAG